MEKHIVFYQMIDHLMESSIGMVRFKRSFEETALEPPSPILLWCKSKMKKHFNKPLKMTKENEIDFQKAIKCHICDQQYTDKDIRVRDHCHITGKFRG